MRAAIQGVSFIPMAGMTGSDLRTYSDFRTVADPYTGQEWVAIPAIRPDWAVIHAHAADEDGNVRLLGAKYDDVLKAKAANRVLVTCERLMTAQEVEERQELTDLPGFLIDAVAVVPGGAWPHSCEGLYAADDLFFADYLAACRSAERYAAFLHDRVLPDREVVR